MKKISLAVCPVLAVGLMLCVAAVSAPAATLYVWTNCPTPGSPYNDWTNAALTIQTAVDAASVGDTVMVTNGIYEAGGTKTPSYALTNRLCVTKSLTIRSVNGPAVTIIKGRADGVTGACGDAAVRCAYLAAENIYLIGFTLAEGCTLTNGDVYFDKSGGGIFFHGYNNEVVSNCVILGNKAFARGAGAVFYYSGTLANCTLTANTGTMLGGGASGSQGGGAAFVYGYSLAAINHCVLNCNTSSYGGGVAFDRGGVVNSCTFSNNKATAYGGGAYFGLESGTLNNSMLAANSADIQGGGAYFGNPGSMNNCLLIGNTTVNFGGNVYFNGYGTLNNCTLTAGGPANGAFMNNGGALTNCIVWGNTNLDISISTTGNVSYTCSSPKQSGEGNIGDNPRFADTNAGNYRLSSGSPCVDSGTNQGWMASSYDLDGRTRIRYGRVDMGAYELINSGTIYGFY